MGVRFHFLNVGSGDCAIIHFPARVRNGVPLNERIMVVDMNHNESHEYYEDVIQYYKKNFKNPDGSIQPIFRFVFSHAHQDHISGLAQFFEDNQINIINFWDVEHEFEPENFDGHPTHSEDWEAYKGCRSRNDGSKVLSPYRETAPGLYWNSEEDSITILSPSKEMVKKVHQDKEDGSKRKPHEVDVDYISYALLIRINNIKVILAGDGKEDVWSEIYQNSAGLIKDCQILKAGHHGHESAYHEDAVKLMNPKYIVFSNSQEQDVAHGADGLYRKALPDAKIYKTFATGTIVADCDFNGGISFSKNSSKSYNAV